MGDGSRSSGRHRGWWEAGRSGGSVPPPRSPAGGSGSDKGCAWIVFGGLAAALALGAEAVRVLTS
jgi:hypothetical protein